MVSVARTQYLERIRILNKSLSDPILIDRAPSDIDHNERARFLRNGLAIIAFNILEDFTKRRIEELLNIVASCGISFNALPEKMQISTLLDALKGIHKLGQRKKKNLEDWKTFIQTEASKLSSSSSAGFQISSYGIGWDKSNLDSEDIKSFISIFQVRDGWSAIYEVTRAIGCTIISPSDFFKNAASRRHSAAHDPNAATPLTDIQDYARSVNSLALAIDCLMSKAVKLIVLRDVNFLARTPVAHSDLKMRYIKKVGNDFKEMSSSNSVVIKTHPNELDAFNALVARRNYNNEMIVVLDSPSNVYSWYTAL